MSLSVEDFALHCNGRYYRDFLGELLGGATLRSACVRAGEFVRDTIAYTAEQHTDPNFGVQFEKLLPRLILSEK